MIDQNVYDWFLTKTIGIENLASLWLEDITKIDDFIGYDASRITSGHNALINSRTNKDPDDGFRSIDVQKIGKVRQKLK